MINGSTVKVSFSVIEDTDKELRKNDSIELLRVSNDDVVDSVKRGKKKNGTVSLKVKNSEGEQLYVHYKRKGKAGDVITRVSHPADPGFIALLSIPRQSLADLTIGLNAVGVGTASISGTDFQNENTDAAQTTGCQWARGDGLSYFQAVAGATAASCDPYANIQLPHGRTMTEFRCTVFDNSASNSIFFIIRSVSLSTGEYSNLFITPASTDSLSAQQISATTIDSSLARIDNTAFAYKIVALYGTNDFSTLGSDGGIYGCSVVYQ